MFFSRKRYRRLADAMPFTYGLLRSAQFPLSSVLDSIETSAFRPPSHLLTCLLLRCTFAENDPYVNDQIFTCAQKLAIWPA